ncbi:MAG: DNA recombination protein RmuC, partial [Halioglobus sp.]|nr:DNA recombination protein RmuC [Halioglobus sp.]
QVCRVAERLDRLGNSMRAAQNHYNDTVTSLAGKQGLYGKVERFQQLSAKTRDKLPGIEPIHEDLEQTRLEVVSRDMETATSNTEPDASPTAGG